MSELLIHYALFERVEDRTPVCKRSATLRYIEPSLLSLLDPLPSLRLERFGDWFRMKSVHRWLKLSRGV